MFSLRIRMERELCVTLSTRFGTAVPFCAMENYTEGALIITNDVSCEEQYMNTCSHGMHLQ